MSNINDVSNVSNNNIRKRRSGTIQYLLDPVKYENYSKCRNHSHSCRLIQSSKI